MRQQLIIKQLAIDMHLNVNNFVNTIWGKNKQKNKIFHKNNIT